jgi:hypothetical protein
VGGICAGGVAQYRVLLVKIKNNLL